MNDLERLEKIKSEQKAFIELYGRENRERQNLIARDFMHQHSGYLIERMQELETYVEEHSKKSVELNLFLQKRNTSKYLGMHVIDSVMEYVQELENHNLKYFDMHGVLKQKNKRYRDAIQKAIAEFNHDEHRRGMQELRKVLEELQ